MNKVEKPKRIMAYVKEWETRPDYWSDSGDMDYLCGTVVEVASPFPGVVFTTNTLWGLKTEDVIIVEGSLET